MALQSVSLQGKNSFLPPGDTATYRDLLLFEERLKTNAAILQRRKSRYQLFLAQLIITICFLLSEVLLQTAFLTVPYRFLLRLSPAYVEAIDMETTPHPFLVSGLLFVAVTTLILFFASGMYSEKIAYANQYVPRANKALRTFNMHLNVRRPPLRSKFLVNLLAFIFPRYASSSVGGESQKQSVTRVAAVDRHAPVPIPPIPPANNPRGELIFSSRVDRSFRESYERYRAAFERKRDERARFAASQTWLGGLKLKLPWGHAVPESPSVPRGSPVRSSLRSPRRKGTGGMTHTTSSSGQDSRSSSRVGSRSTSQVRWSISDPES